MTIEFPEYGWFYYLLREIFIRENYYFPCNKIPKIIDAANFIYMATGTGVASFEFFCPEGFARNYDKCNE